MSAARPPRTLVVWCPDWPVTAVGIGARTPGAVLAQGRVAACSAAARAAGVRRGQRLRDAQRRCPDLVLAERDTDTEGRLFERVVTALAELTPKVETLRPGVCATPVRGPARYYGGEEEYRTRVVNAVTEAGFACGAGIADGMFAAGLAARTAFEPTNTEPDPPGLPGSAGVPDPPGPLRSSRRPIPSRPASGPLEASGPSGGLGPASPADGPGTPRPSRAPVAPPPPSTSPGAPAAAPPEAPAVGSRVALLSPPVSAAGRGGGVVVPPGKTRAFLGAYSIAVLDRPELGGLLDRLGVRTLGDLAALPAGQVAERFGTDGAMVHRLAQGLDPRPLAPRPPRTDLSRAYEFDPPADSGDRVVFAAKALAEELHAGLAAGGLTCVRLSIELTWDDGRELTRLWRHDGALSALAVAERVRWQIAGVREPDVEDETDAPGGVRLLRLAPDTLVPDIGEQQALWGQTSVSGRVGRAAARVQALLGHHAIVRPVLTGGRGPAERVARVPVGDLPPEEAADGPWPAHVPDPAPAVVHPAPIPVAVTDASGAPVTVDGRCRVPAPPVRLRTPAGEAEVTAWTGPWPAHEFWWDPERAHRRARFQVVTGDGHAYLLVLEDGAWYLEAAYG